MRLYLKRLIGFCTLSLVVWFVVSHFSVIEVPNTVSNDKPNVLILEERINKLQQDISRQVFESHKLLEEIKSIKESGDVGSKPNVEEKHNSSNVGSSTHTVLPVLVISCDRVTVKRCLDNLIKYRTNKETFPIIVSQDCGHEPTYNVIQSFTSIDPTITVIRQPDLSEIPLPRSAIKFRGYYKIARHFKFALNHVFKSIGHEAVIIIEDDLDVSPDLFEYFLGTYPLLIQDPSLWCISAWNDNGKKELIDRTKPELLHRTDFFPGLGWLLRKESWLKLEPKWPQAYFDDWLRDPKNVDSRSCIRPEISRTYSFGKVGVSKGQYFDMHLRYLLLNTDFVEFTKLNLSYLLKDNYDKALEEKLTSLPSMTAPEALTAPLSKETAVVKVPYMDAKSFQRAAKKLGLMDDFRSGVPRTAYRGVVACSVRGRRVYLAPGFHWAHYDPAWG